MDITSNNYKKKVWGVAVLAVTTILIVIFFSRAAIQHELINLKLVPQKETFTELYFNNVDSLPIAASNGGKGTFSFTIHNEEGVQTVYPYLVFFLAPNGRRTIFARGTAMIDSKAYQTITAPYTFSTATQKGMVVVLLTNLNQQIDFLIPNTNGN